MAIAMVSTAMVAGDTADLYLQRQSPTLLKVIEAATRNRATASITFSRYYWIAKLQTVTEPVAA